MGLKEKEIEMVCDSPTSQSYSLKMCINVGETRLKQVQLFLCVA